MSHDFVDEFGFPLTNTDELRLSPHTNRSQRVLTSTAFVEIDDPRWRSLPKQPTRQFNLDAFIEKYSIDRAARLAAEVAEVAALPTLKVRVDGSRVEHTGKPPFRVVAHYDDPTMAGIMGATKRGNVTVVDGRRRDYFDAVLAAAAVDALNVSAGAPA